MSCRKVNKMNLQESLIAWDRTFCKSEKTKRAYTTGLKVFIGYLKKNGIAMASPIEALRPDLFIGYPAWLSMYSKETLGVYLSGVRSFMNWLTINGYLEMTYSQNVRWHMAVKESGSKHGSRLQKFPKADDAERMIAAVKSMPGYRLEKLRNIALVLFLASSGCRNEEATLLHVRDLNLDECSTSVIGKGDKERLVFFSKETAEAIRTYLDGRQASPDEPLFIRHDKRISTTIEAISTNAVRDVVKAVAEYAEVKQFTPHTFRHSFAIFMLEKTHNLAQVQDLLGHANPETTRLYATIPSAKLQASYREAMG